MSGPKYERRALSLGELLAKEFPAPELIIGEWLPTGGICELWGPRGSGKSFVTLGIGLAVASGFSFCEMGVKQPRKVLYVDGEMPITMVQSRLRKLVKGQGPYPERTYVNFGLLSHMMFERGIPDLSDRASGGWRLIEQEAEGFELIILDNLSSLLRSGVENDAESWHSFNEWLLRLRRLGKSVLVIHHSGKANSRGEFSQRGTSRREDQMDTCIQLVSTGTHPLTCEWTYTKHRAFQPDPGKFELQISFGEEEDSARIHLAEDPMAEVEEMLAEGRSYRDIQKKTGCSKSAVGRRAQKLREADPSPA